MCKFCQNYQAKIKENTLQSIASKDYQKLDKEHLQKLMMTVIVKYLKFYPEILSREDVNLLIRELFYQHGFFEKSDTEINIAFDRRNGNLTPLSSQTGQCHSPSHNSMSPFHITKVPIEFFMKILDDPVSSMYKYCAHCREKERLIEPSRVRDKKIRENSEKVAKDTGILFCLGNPKVHAKYSSYPRDKVPINYFRKERDNPHSEILLRCINCREYYNAASIELQRIRQEKASLRGNFFCRGCRNEKKLDEKAINIDGSTAVCCVLCKEKSTESAKKIKKFYENIKREFMLKIESCCERCNRIFLFVESKLIRLNTFLQNGRKMVEYNNILCYSGEFLLTYGEVIDFHSMELDHLTEKEQRERGLLNKNEKFIPKKKTVRAVGCEFAMKLEARKTQLLCCECHTIVTIEREIEQKKETINLYVNPLEKTKKDYVYNLKQSGCIQCGYKNPDLPRFFDMDHINPIEKIDCISAMISGCRSGSYTLDQVKEECKKTRVLCRPCHRRHTKLQWEQGIFHSMRRSGVWGKKNRKIEEKELNEVEQSDGYISSENSDEELEMFKEIDELSENEEELELEILKGEEEDFMTCEQPPNRKAKIEIVKDGSEDD